MSALLAVLLAAAPSGTATVPLGELMELVQPKVGEAAPVAGVTSLTLAGRPGEAGLWLDVEATVRVLSGSAVSVRLLEVSPETVVESLPDTADAVVTLKDGAVIATCHAAGAHRLAFKLLVRATRDGRRSSVRFETSSLTPPTPLKLDADDTLFELPGATIVSEWGGYVVFPVRHVYQVAWASKQEQQQKPALAQRAPVDPLVKDAMSRWVMTLEGRATHEVKLTLQLDRPGVMKIEAPEGQRVLRARANGVPLAVEEGTRTLTIDLAPASLGAAEATVELAVAQDFGVFHLSGGLELGSPRISWPVSRWTTEAVLPKVFTWERRGGSMEQLGVEAEARGEVPGKALFFTQHLISASGPVISLGYSVDLRGSYFR
ncbi:MAG: hypothetical protein JNJ54_05435 [Myxococcaceae bacterium]|nr:hypothetical protein [Myxococcaceae bacterium]